MQDHRHEIRASLKNYFPEYESSLIFLFDYTNVKKSMPSKDIASFVFGFKGFDYHYYLKNAFNDLYEVLNDPTIIFKTSIDSSPVLERDFAYQTGLGWFGKNSMLINKKGGSFFIIGMFLMNKKLPLKPTSYYEPNHCGSCRACIDACPTKAIDPKGYFVDAKKCISTFTIEEFKEVDPPIGYDNSPYYFGCDICQNVCPWNIKPLKDKDMIENIEYEFQNNSVFQFMKSNNDYKKNLLDNVSKRSFRKLFKNTSFERLGKEGLLKNLKNLKCFKE